MNFSNIYDGNKNFTSDDEKPNDTSCHYHPQLNFILGIRVAVPTWEALAIATILGNYFDYL